LGAAVAGCALAKPTSTATPVSSPVPANSPAAASQPASATTSATTAVAQPTNPSGTPVPSNNAAASPTGSASPVAFAGTPTVVGTPAANPTDQAIQAVILRGNLEQSQAIARNDPTLMKDTSTSTYYNQSVQGNQQLSDAGATSIGLVKLVWGPISVQGSTAQATTYENWQTLYSNGQTELQENVRNVYTLTQSGNQWLIQADDHPDEQAQQTGTGGPTRRRPPPPSITTTPPAAVTPTTDQSRNWSGYDATSGTFTSVTGTWIVPHINASSANGATTAGDATWVGIGGVQSRDLIQAGSESDVVGPGDTVYDTWIEMLPRTSQTVPLAVLPGDSVTVTITQSQPGSWSIAMKNNTSGKTYQTTVKYQSSNSSAEWVEEAPSAQRGIIPLDNFGTVQFSNCTAVRDGKTLSLSDASAQAITMAGRGGQPLAVPSQLASDGRSFSVTQASA
jgi:hypothetical protein